MAIKERASGVFGRVQRLVDVYVIKPETRSQCYSNIGTFASNQPILAVRQDAKFSSE